MSFGFKSDELEMIRAVFREFPEIEEVIIFGSRAMGNYKPASDVDLALKGHITKDILARIRMRLNEDLPLAYIFDVFDLSTISHKALLDHIAQHGRTFFAAKTP